VGERGKDNGVLLVVAMRERSLRIEPGRGLEDELTDLESGRIIRERIAPLMRRGDVGGAIEMGTLAVRQALGDTEVGDLPPPPAEPDEEPNQFPAFAFGLFPLLFFLFLANRRRRGGRGRRQDFGVIPIFWGGGWGGSTGGGFGGGGGGGFGGGGGGMSGGGGASGGW
jgi:uncharacterized protein